MTTCHICGGYYDPALVRFSYIGSEGDSIIVDNVPAEECQCGQRLFTSDVVSVLERIKADDGPYYTDVEMHVPVFDFANLQKR